MTDHDLIVIGAGAVGENVADYARKRGLSVAIVEAELVGGECSYWACMPSKALLRSGHAVAAAKRLDGAAQAVTGSLDAARVLARRNSFTSDWKDDGQVSWLESADIALIRGHARITGPKTIEVDGETHTARAAVAVVTGSLHTLPDVPGLADAKPWGTREATSAQEVPESLLVIGGGVSGSELATAWASLGAKVTLVARHGLLGGMEPFAGELVADAMRELGIDVRTGVNPTRVDRDEHGLVTTTLDDGTTVVTSEVLAATGRAAQTKDLGLESVGLTPGAWLDVDDTMLVHGTDWLYAVGDVNHRVLLTHQGKYQAGPRARRSPPGSRARRCTPSRGVRTSRPPTTPRSPRSRSPTPRSPASGSPRNRPGSRGCTSAPSSTTSARSPVPRCRPTATPDGRRWSSTRTGRWSSG